MHTDKEELHALRQFYAAWVENFFGEGCTDIDGSDFQDMAVNCGLLCETTYDPARHGESIECEPGDCYFEQTEIGAAALEGARSGNA
jgi:hypothetical protein